MTYFVWTNILSTGHARIDEDHRKLFEMINAFYNAMEQNRGKEVTGRVLDNLVNYYRVHFRREEEAMQRIGYDGYLEHKLAHENFISEVDLLKKNFNSGATINPVYVGKMLTDWLRSHIATIDTKLAAVLGQDL